MDESAFSLSPLLCFSQAETSVSSSASQQHHAKKSSQAFHRRRSLSLSKKHLLPQNGIRKRKNVLFTERHNNTMRKGVKSSFHETSSSSKVFNGTGSSADINRHFYNYSHNKNLSSLPSQSSNSQNLGDLIPPDEQSSDVDFLPSAFSFPSNQSYRHIDSENLPQQSKDMNGESNTLDESVAVNGDVNSASVVVKERYQMAFLDEYGNIIIPYCCQTMDVELALPCPDVDTFLINFSKNSRELLEDTPYLYLPDNSDSLEKFIMRSFASISKQIKRCRAMQLKHKQCDSSMAFDDIPENSLDEKPEAPSSISSTTLSSTTAKHSRKEIQNDNDTKLNKRSRQKVEIPIITQWQMCDAAIIALRRATFNMLMRILPDMDVSSFFDCNTPHVDQMVDCIIDSLYSSTSINSNNLSRVKLSNSDPIQRELVVSLCYEPQKCLDNLRQRVLTLVMLLCPFLEVPPSFSVEKDLITLLKHVQPQVTS